MKVVEIKKKALEIDKEDWHMMSELATGFKNVCEHFQRCIDCPLYSFNGDKCICPSEYLFDLMEFLDD